MSEMDNLILFTCVLPMKPRVASFWGSPLGYVCSACKPWFVRWFHIVGFVQELRIPNWRRFSRNYPVIHGILGEPCFWTSICLDQNGVSRLPCFGTIHMSIHWNPGWPHLRNMTRTGWGGRGLFYNFYIPWRIHGAGILMLTWLGYIDGIHGTPYIAAPWIL